jgi:RNA polymerase sigma factor (sigma-70 family)
LRWRRAPEDECGPDPLQRALDVLRAGGDPEQGYARLLRCFQKRILNVIRRTSRLLDFEGLTQETLMNVLGKGAACPAKLKEFEAYLFRAARNACISALRNRPQWLSLEDDPALVEERLAAPPSQEEEAIRRQESEKIRKALDQLSPGQRRCLMLTVQGHSRREIARLRRCDEETVKALLYQGRLRLRELLRED